MYVAQAVFNFKNCPRQSYRCHDLHSTSGVHSRIYMKIITQLETLLLEVLEACYLKKKQTDQYSSKRLDCGYWLFSQMLVMKPAEREKLASLSFVLTALLVR